VARQSQNVDLGTHPSSLPDALLTGLSFEISVHIFILEIVVVPLQAVFSPYFFTQEGVVAFYRVARRLIFLVFGTALNPVEQVRAEANAFYNVAFVVTAVFIVFGVLAYRRQLTEASRLAAPLGFRGRFERRYRPIPDALRQVIEPKFTRLWRRLSADKPVPSLSCFAATKVSACAFTREKVPEIAVSTALLELIRDDRNQLVEIILLHEMSHLLSGDPKIFDRAKALFSACRVTLIPWIALLGSLFFHKKRFRAF
jgi:Zn-dependent protease with chaperone function